MIQYVSAFFRTHKGGETMSAVAQFPEPTAAERDQHDLLTLDEICQELKIHPTTLQRLRRSGELPAVYIAPRSPRIRRSDLAAFLARRSEQEYTVIRD
jgi:excisionase family DNA binding protein